jgi:8-oxo-dGTP pyrophosphatase MutT (NUDIX family)
VTLAGRLRAALENGIVPDELIAGDVAVEGELVPAAVLVAVTDRDAPGVILTQRTETLRRHPGQVAFPGGRIDPGEAVIAAALREAWEEVALPPDRVEVVGTADRYVTGTRYDVTPVVGVVPPDLPLVPHEAEVAAVFEVPLAFLLDHANHRAMTTERYGRTVAYWEIGWEGRRIWGATAAMIVNLARRLRW